jgi:hypothetical protein
MQKTNIVQFDDMMQTEDPTGGTDERAQYS